MLDIDIAIKHCLDIADGQDKCADISVSEHAKERISKCAADHRQLAEWLTELKELKETKQNIVHAYWIRGKEYGFKTHNSTWYCSNCGGSIRYDTTPRTYQKQKKPVEEVNCFCRKCGARMDLKDGDTK